MRALRLFLEIIGSAAYLAASVGLAWVYVLGSTLEDVQPVVYWTAVALGYLGMAWIAFARRARFAPVSARAAFDLWLVTAFPALALGLELVTERWPLSFRGWGGHTPGASGGEANAALYPWLHTLLWAFALAVLAWRARRGGEGHPG
jgi:hypothetical protein